MQRSGQEIREHVPAKTIFDLSEPNCSLWLRDYLTPIALRYGYSETPLETNIKWRPLVLVLGNYSSGKSTLINEFLDADVQGTGQAPTDDSFTIITYDSEQDKRRPDTGNRRARWQVSIERS